jgi:DnaJ-class molecular chaperone
MSLDYIRNNIMSRIGWIECKECKGTGYARLDEMVIGLDVCSKCEGRGEVAADGYKICEECDGFGTVGVDRDDIQDMGSFEEDCPVCKGEGAVEIG